MSALLPWRIGRGKDPDRRVHGRRNRFTPRLDVLELRSLLATWTVASKGDDPLDRLSLRYAVDHAGDGDSIKFSPGMSNKTIILQEELFITTSVLIVASSAPVTVRGGEGRRVFNVGEDAKVWIAGLTIRGGDVDVGKSEGGGVLNAGLLTLRDCTVTGNKAASGGGIFNTGTLEMTDCTVSDNMCTVADGKGGGGGIGNTGKIHIINSTINNNTSARYGGGLMSGYGDQEWKGVIVDAKVIMEGCTVSNNTATCGAGIYNWNNDVLTVRNSTISGNSASSFGGGIQCWGSADLESVTLAGNSGGWIARERVTIDLLLQLPLRVERPFQRRSRWRDAEVSGAQPQQR